MIKQISNVWINSIIPIAKGCFICVKIKLTIKEIIEIKNCKMSENSLFKILILGINDRDFSFSEALKK